MGPEAPPTERDDGDDDLVVEAAGDAPAGDVHEGDATSGWRAPRPAAFPANPLLPPPRDLALDRSALEAPPPEPATFVPMRLEQRQPGLDAGHRSAPGGRPRATAYDRKRPLGRTRWHEIFEPEEADFWRRVRAKRHEGMLIGAAYFWLAGLGLAGALPLGAIGLVLFGAIGAGLGLVAVEYGGDGTFAWAALSVVCALCLVPFVELLMIVPFGALAVVCGWIVGIAREARLGISG